MENLTKDSLSAYEVENILNYKRSFLLAQNTTYSWESDCDEMQGLTQQRQVTCHLFHVTVIYDLYELWLNVQHSCTLQTAYY